MKNQRQPKLDLTEVSDHDGLTMRVASCFSAVSEPGMEIWMGRNHPGKLLRWGGITLLGWYVFFPRYGEEITTFGIAWLALLAVQKALATWNHHWGSGANTESAGIPLISYLIGHERFVRRWVNPLALYFLADLATCPATVLLLKASAAGQAVVWFYMARVTRADDDGRYNAQRSNW